MTQQGREQMTDITLGVYRHYKGNLYQVLGISRHSETLEPHVVYQALYGDYGLWVRPRGLFTSVVETEEGAVPRFAYVGPSVAAMPVLDVAS